jgi:hypothetical protein
MYFATVSTCQLRYLPLILQELLMCSRYTKRNHYLTIVTFLSIKSDCGKNPGKNGLELKFRTPEWVKSA